MYLSQQQRQRGLLVLLVVIVVSVTTIYGCGATQHTVIANKAYTWYQPSIFGGEEYDIFLNILAQNQGALQNGAVFPDWGYSCGFPDESEAAHWPPFTLAAADYVQNNCGGTPSSWDSHCQQLVAFFFGMVSHQIADVAWHDLAAVSDTHQGFIQTMADLDFQGDYGDAHSAADTGGEFIVAKEFDLSFIDLNWYLPAEDLAVIYQKMRYNVTSENIKVCNELLYVEVQAVRVGGALLYPWVAKKSTFITDQLKDFWLGGIDDNAIWTQWCWEEYLMYWFSPDISGPTRDYKLCAIQYPMFGQCERCYIERPKPKLQFKEAHFPGVKSTVDEHGAINYHYTSEFVTSVEEYAIQTIKDLNSNEITFEEKEREEGTSLASACFGDINASNSSITFSIDTYSAYLGNSLATGDINSDGIDDLLIGAPGYGTTGYPEQGGIFISLGSKNTPLSATNVTFSTPNIMGNGSHDRFGWAIHVMDLNLDQVNDIIVSAPTTEARSLQYMGSVYVFFGDASNPSKYTSYNALNAANADLTIYSSENYTNLGSVLKSGDCNNDGHPDLVIGAPYSTKGGSSKNPQYGKVFILYATASLSTLNIDAISIEQYANVTILGAGEVDWFGYSIEFGTNGATPLLFVSSPMKGQNPPSVGKLYAFNISALHEIDGNNYGNSLIFTIVGENKWDQVAMDMSFGSYLSSSTVLAIALPSYTPSFSINSEQIGAVYLVDVSKLSGDLTISKVRELTKLEGDEKYARFGWNAKLIDMNGRGDWNLWVSQPRKKTSEGGTEAGAVYQWDALQNPSHTSKPSESSETCVYSMYSEERYGESLAFLDYNGDSIMDTVIAAPRRTSNMNGAVVVLLS